MGYTEGTGLGSKKQGRVDAKETEVRQKHDRRGIGAKKGNTRGAVSFEFQRGPNAWISPTATPQPGVDGDMIFSWSKWRSNGVDEDEKNIPEFALDFLRGAILQPNCREARGPRITRMETLTRYYNEELLCEMLTYKVYTPVLFFLRTVGHDLKKLRTSPAYALGHCMVGTGNVITSIPLLPME